MSIFVGMTATLMCSGGNDISCCGDTNNRPSWLQRLVSGSLTHIHPYIHPCTHVEILCNEATNIRRVTWLKSIRTLCPFISVCYLCASIALIKHTHEKTSQWEQLFECCRVTAHRHILYIAPNIANWCSAMAIIPIGALKVYLTWYLALKFKDVLCIYRGYVHILPWLLKINGNYYIWSWRGSDVHWVLSTASVRLICPLSVCV